MNESSRFDRRKQRTREQLRQAAAELIRERGYDAVSIQDITDRADLGRGTFYLHFRDKEEIAASIIQEAFEALERAGAGALDGLSVKQRDYVGFIGYFMFTAQQGTLLRALSSSSGAAGITHYIAQYTYQRAMMRLEEENIFPDVPMEVAAAFMTGSLMRLTTWWAGHSEHYMPQQVAAMYYRMLHHEAPPELPSPPAGW